MSFLCLLFACLFCRNDSEKVFLQILTATLLNLYQKNPDLAKKYFFNKVFRSFRGVYSDFKVNLKNGENSKYH